MRATGCATPVASRAATAAKSTMYLAPSDKSQRGWARPPAKNPPALCTPRTIQWRLARESSPPDTTPRAPGHPPSTPPAAAAGASSTSTAWLTRRTSSTPIALLSLRPLQGTEEVTKSRGDAHREPDQREPGGAAEPPVDEIAANRAAGGGHHEREADTGERDERPPRRRLLPHPDSFVRARPRTSCEQE